MAEMNRLARLRPGNLGNLGFLPIEVCNKIYAYLLTEFEPCIFQHRFTDAAIASLKDFKLMTHSIETAILRASRDVHREAYDLMVKQNRFVRINFLGVPPSLLKKGAVPLVTVNTDHVRQFKGYVLEVRMSYHGEMLPGQTEESGLFEAMMLAENLNRFCQFVMLGNVVPRFSGRLFLRLHLGLVVAAGRKGRKYKDLGSLAGYFTEKTQKELLQPFRDKIYGVRHAHVRGLVSADTVSSTLKDMASSKWEGPQHALDYLSALKETGIQIFRTNRVEIASELWAQGIVEIEMLHTGDDWSKLAQEGSEQFIHQLAELYLLLNLNCAHAYLREGSNNLFLQMAGTCLIRAGETMETGHWEEGFTFRPPVEFEAKLHFRRARFYRLRGDLNDNMRAMNQIDQALLLCPNDSAILAERRLLVAEALGNNNA